MTEINLICAQYTQSYPGQLMPNVVDVWDEGTVDQNEEGFAAEVLSHRKRIGTDYENVAVVRVAVDTEVIEADPSEMFDAESDRESSYFSPGSSALYGMRLIVVKIVDFGEPYIEVTDCWDEFVLEDNQQGFYDAVEKQLARVEVEWVKVVDIAVDTSIIEDALAPERHVHSCVVLAQTA